MGVTDAAILRIRDMIVSGELTPGMRLPPEKEFAERLGLSRNSMREAVKALEVIRVLDVRQGDGTYVTSLEPRLLLEALSFVADLHGDESLLEVFQVRRILEKEVFAMAATRIDAATIAQLRAIVSDVSPETDVEGLVAHDLAFHDLVATTAGNAYLATLLRSLSGDTVRARIWRALTQEHVVERTLQEHDGLIDALERGDATLAASLAHVHIAGVEQWIAPWADDVD